MPNASNDGCKIRTARLPSGEHIPLLVEKTGIPVLMALAYAIDLRNRGFAVATILSHLQGVRRGWSFLDERCINLDDRIVSGVFLRRDELGEFATRCRARIDGSRIIDPSVSATYYDAFNAFVVWRSEYAHVFAPTANRISLTVERERFRKRAVSYRPRLESSALTAERCGLDENQRALLFHVTKPSFWNQGPKNDLNPFYIKYQGRNFAIFALAYFLGLRSGELLGLIRDDYDRRSVPPTITIHRRPDNSDDPRRVPATTKTRPRMLALTEEVALILDHWLEQRRDRGLYPEARRNRFLFVAADGKPLSLRGLRAIYQRLRAQHPALGAFCNHVLRHDMNERAFGEEYDGSDEGRLLTDMRYINGWSEKSNMHLRYAKRSIAKRANARITSRQRRILTET